MKFEFNKSGAERKELVKAIAEIMNAEVKYLGVPSCAYRVDYFTISKNGTVEFDDRADSEEIETLMEELAARGFIAESHEVDEPERPELVISIPIEKVNLENLKHLLAAKGSLIKKALGITSVDITADETQVNFPWFTELPGFDEIETYTRFIEAMCKMSVKQKRVTAKEKNSENEKYTFRCFLLRLGFIGEKYKFDRKLLLKNLEGSSAFRGGAKHEISA